MDSVKRAFLDFAASVPESFFLIVKSAFALSCFLLYIPCLIVMMRSKAVHTNCKLLIVCSSITQQLMLLTQVAMFSYDWFIGNYRPDSEDNELAFCLIHEAGYFLTTYLSLILLAERYTAAKRCESYERCKVGHLKTYIIGAIGFALSIVFACAVHKFTLYFQSILMMVVAEILVILGSGYILYYCHRRNRVLPYDLGSRYQLIEVYCFTRAILVPIMISAAIKRVGNWSENVKLLMHAFNAVLVKILLIIRHRGFRQTFYTLFCTKKFAAARQPKVGVAVTGASATAIYFSDLQRSWDTTIPAPQTTTRAPSPPTEDPPIPTSDSPTITLD